MNANFLSRQPGEKIKGLGIAQTNSDVCPLRHAFVTTLLHLGVDLRTIADISGHDVRTMLTHHAHSMSSARRKAIGQLPILHPVGAENNKAAKKAASKTPNKIS